MIASTQTNHPLAVVTVEKEAGQAPNLTEIISSKLRAAGLRHTQPRLAIFRALTEFKEPASIEQIYLSIKNKSCDLVTVYRSLALFEELGLVVRSFSSNGTGLYELKREGEENFYFTSKDTGRREALDSESAAELSRVLKKISMTLTDKGYSNITYRVDFQGLADSVSPVTAEILASAQNNREQAAACSR